MREPHDPNRTVDVPSDPADSLDAGLAAGFVRPAEGPSSVLSALRDSLGPLRPVLLREAQGESAHVIKPKSDAMPSPELTGDRCQLQGEIARFAARGRGYTSWQQKKAPHHAGPFVGGRC